MRFSKVPLALALLSLGCFCLASEASAAADAAATPSAAPAAAAPPATPSSSSSSSGKPKRDAGLSFSSYHGPSHKYLPPAYEGHQLSYHGGGGGGYHGNSLSSYTTDYGHLESESGNGNGGGHHYAHHGYGYGAPARPQHHHQHHHYVPSPKIETYIVQTTSSNSGSGHGYHGHSGSHSLGHGPSHSLSHGPSHSLSHGPSHSLSHSFSHGSSHGLGYKYPAPASSGGGAGSSAYLNLLGGHKTSTYLVATPEFSGGSLHRPGSGYSSHPAPSHGYSHGFGHGYSHHQISSGSTGSHGPTTSHVDHSLEHALEHGLSHALGLGLGHSSGGGGGGRHHGPVFAQHPLPQPAEEHSGYTYDAPATPFGKGTPLSSYGVPLIPGYDHQQESLQEQVLEQEHKLEREQERETPVYALGHKGLGHFSYTASKPQALHTDVLGGGNGGVTHPDLELSKAPFKPSAFLGAKHESGSGSVTNSIAGYDYATPTSPFLQAPSSPGYDYQAPAQLYGPPGHSGDSATPIFEPEATYLPPASSYGPPATSSHGYH
ncbi:hypothetical protein KR038_008784 [Drosophila bunnanda]|nr:hypothetical protein KR038_008784 [Drosophila bunnanda]